MDAITMLKDDHHEVEKLFKRFEKAGDRAFKEKRDIVDRIIEALSIHAAIEEQLFYPVTRQTVPETDDDVLEAIEEHQIVKWLLHDLQAMDPQDERFDAKVTVLIENVRHHVEEEEQDYFPKVREELGRNDLSDLGEAMEAARKIAPTHPHPRSPSTPPGNLVIGTVAGAADRIGDTVSGVAQGSVAAAQDLVALILRRERPSHGMRGSSVSRTTARRVRGDAQSAADDLIGAIKDARKVGEDTVDAARSGAKGVVTSAARGAERTAGAAESGAKGTATSARRNASRTSTTGKRAATTTGRTAKASAKNTKATAKRAATTTKKAASS
jgi:hemerythrin superfamily protein